MESASGVVQKGEIMKVYSLCSRCRFNKKCKGHVKADMGMYYCTRFKHVGEKMSYADKIRSMTDKELVEWIHKHDKNARKYGFWSKRKIRKHLETEVAK